MRRILLPMLLIAAMSASAESKVPTEKSVRLDLDGDGKAETVVIRSLSGNDMTSFNVTYAGQTLKMNGVFGSDGDDLWPILKPVTPFPDSRQEWLKVEGIFSGITDSTCWLIGLKDGRLSVRAAFKGMSEVDVPGNGSILTSAWVGFWSRKVKWSVNTKGSLRLVPQEFYAVGSKEVKVKKTFALRMSLDSDAVVARPREGSNVEIVLWEGELPLTEAKQLPQEELEEAFEEPGYRQGAYLIKTETGLLGWATGAELAEFLELPLAG